MGGEVVRRRLQMGLVVLVDERVHLGVQLGFLVEVDERPVGAEWVEPDVTDVVVAGEGVL